MAQAFDTVETFTALLRAAPGPDIAAIAGAQERNAQLTKPPGALGRLEDLAIWYCGWRNDPRARLRAPQIVIFAGNHGVTARGVSAFSPQVTAQMVANFQTGGAAINQLAQLYGAQMDVHALSLDRPTADFTAGPAMDPPAFLEALNIGWQAVDAHADLLVAGEMGIGNTTSASAIAHLLYGGTAAEWTGAGTGVTGKALALKTQVVRDAAARHAGARGLKALRCVGGRELVAMVGAIARARVLRIPVLLDGFICTAAAACLGDAVPGALDHCVAGHVSGEAGHPALLHHLGKEPLLSLGLRLGEGSGGALAIGILQGALACHSGMATFAEAGVAAG